MVVQDITNEIKESKYLRRLMEIKAVLNKEKKIMIARDSKN